MQVLLSKIALKINPNVFKKDPFSSELGDKIVSGSIDLLDELGLENFTFKKLANHIGSTEASIYRYFENKHNLLTYLTMWYWSWMEYRVMMTTLNIEDPVKRLKNALLTVTQEIVEDSDFQSINEVKLNQIVIRESGKVYHCKHVDEVNSEGFFFAYKELVQRIADIIMEIKSDFKYPHMLVSTIIEGAHHQRFFADHLPRLTDIVEGEDAVSEFYIQLALREIGAEK